MAVRPVAQKAPADAVQESSGKKIIVSDCFGWMFDATVDDCKACGEAETCEALRVAEVMLPARVRK